MAKYILSIDQGTTGTTAMLVDLKGKVKSKADQDFKQIFPQPGWVEHNPKDIWQTVNKTIEKVIKISKVKKQEIISIGITNQRETILAWDAKTGEPLSNAIVWQCRRTANICNELKQKNHEESVKLETGLVLDPYFSGSKMMWLIKNNPKVQKAHNNGTLKFGTIDSYLIFKLSGGEVHATDVTNASRTMLMNLKTLSYSSKMLDMFNIKEGSLPIIKPSSGFFAKVKNFKLLLDGTPINGVIGDQQSALLAQNCLNAGDLKVTFGTGSFLLFNTGNEIKYSQQGLLTTVAWQFANEKPFYAIEGGAFICGAAVQWLRDELRAIKKSSEVEKLALKVKDSGGVYFVPALSGLGAPYWDADARGLITGLTRGSNLSHLARATLEAMALQNVDIIEAMVKDSGNSPKQVKVDGGATENSLLMQLQADYMSKNIIRPKNIETTALGAALAAGIGAGVWNKDLIAKLNPAQKVFKPKLDDRDRASKVLEWRKAVSRARSN